MRSLRRTTLLTVLLLFSGACLQRAHEPAQPTLILISLDGFRWDYRARFKTPHLDSLARQGVEAEGLIPSFPTKTFPNHYSIVTGLTPERHGIVANSFYDPEFQADFALNKDEEVRNPRWWGGEPIWVTAERQGRKSATMFWPGSEAPIGGVRPSYWRPFDNTLPNSDRVEQILQWLDLPEESRPVFLTLYFSDVDDLGHKHGPDSPLIAEGVEEVDRAVGQLLDGLEARDLSNVSVIVVSDHGMAGTPPDQFIALDDYLDLGRVKIDDLNPVAFLRPDEDYEPRALEALRNAHPNLSVYRKHDVPSRLQFRNNPRISSLVAIADPGWNLTTRKRLERGLPLGMHGYDNEAESMRGIFLARGPHFKAGERVAAFSNLHVYPLMSHLLGLDPAPNQGDLEAVESLLSNHEENNP